MFSRLTVGDDDGQHYDTMTNWRVYCNLIVLRTALRNLPNKIREKRSKAFTLEYFESANARKIFGPNAEIPLTEYISQSLRR